jgi:hypothetical protein
MNGETWSAQHGPVVRTLSRQVSRIGPDTKTWTKSGPTYPPPPKGAVGGSGPFQIIHCNTDKQHSEESEPIPEPTDEELWLADVARQVEADARPLFAATWIWLLRRALQADEDEMPA